MPQEDSQRNQECDTHEKRRRKHHEILHDDSPLSGARRAPAAPGQNASAAGPRPQLQTAGRNSSPAAGTSAPAAAWPPPARHLVASTASRPLT
jgi:hypothetical protein